MNFIILSIIILFSKACTNFIVSPGASDDGSAFVSYAADSHTLYGCLYFRPAADYPNGTMMEIYDWDSGNYLGKIKQAEHTYNVIANTNEFQVTIGETTYGGLSELSSQPGAKIDYGNLMWITLQRSKTAREAIQTIGSLVAEYGYASEGESFSIGDPNEVWHMEIIGKGKYELGAVWVARRLPDGAIGSHANQARITTFPLNDPDNCLYSKDVVTFAQAHGLYPKEKPASEFSFSDIYDPVNFEGARFCEARVWSFFSKFKDMSDFLDYAQGYNLTNRMPLWIIPDKKLTLMDVMNAKRDHFEKTWFDMTKDFGAWPFESGYRLRPLSFTSGKYKYLNERAVSTQQTGFSFIAQMRKWLDIGGISWFGVDDTYTTVWAPMYSVMTEVPSHHKEGNGAIMEFTYDSIFWIFNMVAQFAYLRYDQVMPDIQAKIQQLETKYISDVKTIDQQAQELYKKNPKAAIQLVTDFSVVTGDELFKEWTALFGFLMTKYLDGDKRTPVPGQKFPKVEFPGDPQYWYDELVAKTGDHFRYPQQAMEDMKYRKTRKTQSKLKYI